MAQTFWTYSGDIAVDDQGRPILCDECPCPGNACFGCVPPIPDVLYVTFFFLGGEFEVGDFARFNGRHEIPWLHYCIWRKEFNEDGIYPIITLIPGSEGNWFVVLDTNPSQHCWIGFFSDVLAKCDPTGNYHAIPPHVCDARSCDDNFSCRASFPESNGLPGQNAYAEVSYT